MPLKILTSPKTTIALGATLGALLFPASALAGTRVVGKMIVPKTLKGALIAGITIPTAAGVLSSSKKARTIVKTTLDPRESIKRGKKIGEIIEEPKKAKEILGITEEMTLTEKIKAGAKTAGKVGAIIAGVGAVGLGVKKVLPTAQKILQQRRAKKELEIIKEQEKAQKLAGLKQVGFTEARPVGLGGVPVAVPSQIQPIGAPQATQRPQPLQNIIQIAVH
ncbi:MAG: hypothetical protein GON13_03785 [Nanoarchaeota archaeon]|nr:hypothetical protein [Nanoarchaeota archaeon]